MHAQPSRDRTAWAMRALLALGALLLGAFIARALTGFGGDPTQRLFATWISDAICLCAVAVCLLRALVEPRDRAIWGLAGLGMLAWSLGNAYWEHNLAAGVSLPNPSLADLGYLLFYPLVYLAVIAGRVLAVRRSHEDRPGIRLWLDGLIGAAACATVGAALVLEPVIAATAGESLAGALTNIAYPTGDLTLLAMLVVTTALVGWRGGRGVALLAGGMALFALSDSLYLIQNAEDTYRPGGVLDAGWLLALIVMAFGAASFTRARVRPADRETFPRERTLVPSFAGLIALVVLGLQPILDVPTAAVICATITLALVIARLAFSLRETAHLLIARAREAGHDALTGLGNRRLLLVDLERCAAEATPEHPTLLLLFDLDGFKVYNDTFGHNAGDSMLIQVAAGLRDALGSRGRAYRIGGDEFCALLSLERAEDPPERIGEELAHAMARHGEGFAVSASHGCALAPLHGRETTTLLRRADDEMYARKGARRPGTESQVQDALLAALSARDPRMEARAEGVTGLAAALGHRIGLDAGDQRAMVHAAALQDIGRIAIPDEILNKSSALSEEERRFLHTHPLIAQRIVGAAPALSYAAQIVRSTHERWDGTGYPDGLHGEAIPLASRIIGLCAAYLALISERPYRSALSSEEAIAELRRGAGAQFDPQLVQELIAVLAHTTTTTTTQPARAPAARWPEAERLVANVSLEQAAGLSARDQSALSQRQLEAELTYRNDHDLLSGQWIRNALAEERFVLYAQPIVELCSGRVTHRELLIRMLSQDGDVIPPGAFIPAAERLGLIDDIDRWVTREGLALTTRGEPVSINISAHSIGDEGILAAVRAAAARGLRRGTVIFEITETAALTNMQDARAFTETLAKLGCEVALDDFGTGFGSFSHLKHLPTSYLKIDVEFVRELTSNPTDQQVVRSIVDVGHSLGQRIIAEGVEDRATAEMLAGFGVDRAQGYHFGAPARISPLTPLELALAR